MRVSDAYIQKGDYLKISNIQIGYTFPKNVLKPVFEDDHALLIYSFSTF